MKKVMVLISKDKVMGYKKISVVEDMFALKSDVTEVENKFNDYTTTKDLEANYATKVKVEEVENKFNDYTTTVDLETNYATKNELNDYATVQYVKNAYPSYAHLNANYKNNTQLTKMLNDYALKSELNTVDSKFNDYTTTVDLETNYMKKGDVVSDDKFTK